MPSIKKVSHKHEAILDMMLANPQMKLRDIAREMGVSQSWLSCIIHSDAFQRKLSERQEEIFNATLMPLKDKIAGAAAVAVEKLSEGVESASPVTDREFVLDATEKLLKAAGFTGREPVEGGINAQQNNFYFGAEALEVAREKMRQRALENGLLKVDQHTGRVEHSPLDKEGKENVEKKLPEAPGFSSGGGSAMGQILQGNSEVCASEAQEEGKEGGGPSLGEES